MISRIRNSGIDMTADVAVKEQRNPEDIVTILVELEAAPAAEVCEDLKAAGDYREQLNASHKTAAAMINEKLGTEIVIKHNYSVVFNGFASRANIAFTTRSTSSTVFVHSLIWKGKPQPLQHHHPGRCG